MRTVRSEREDKMAYIGHKSVRKLPSMARLPLEMRARLPLLCDGEGVYAVPFGPLRDGAKKNADRTLYLYLS